MNATTDATATAARSAFWWAPYAATLLVGFLAGELLGAGGWGSAKDRKTEVRQALESQVAAWNKGDLEGFMDVYWNNDQLAFCGDANLEFGWKTTHDRYFNKYFAPGKERGKLSFDDFDVLYANADAAAVRGRFRLDYAHGNSADGRFVVVLRKIAGAWKIVYDHTSSSPKPAAAKNAEPPKSTHESEPAEKSGVR